MEIGLLHRGFDSPPGLQGSREAPEFTLLTYIKPTSAVRSRAVTIKFSYSQAAAKAGMTDSTHPESDTPGGPMDRIITDNTPLSELTVGELREVFAGLGFTGCLPGVVYGLQGLADLLGTSVSTVKRWYPILRPAIAKRGRTVVVDTNKALQLWAGRRNFLNQ